MADLKKWGKPAAKGGVIGLAMQARQDKGGSDTEAVPLPSCVTQVIVRRLIVLLAGALIVSAFGLASPVLAQAESIEITHGAEPTQDIALNISVSGVADGHHRLYVIVHESSEACATYPDFETGTYLASGESLSAGTYEKTYSYTPPQPGTYTICAYLDEAEYDIPDVTSTASFTAVMPSGSVSIEVTGKMTQEVPLKIKVSGTTEVPRKLYVTVHESGEACSTYPDFETGTHLASGESLSAGAYSKEYSYTPPQPGTYTICGYIDEAEYSTPDATGSGSFTAGMPAGSVSVAVSPSSSENAPVSIKVSGSTEVSRKLYVVVHESGEACATYPDFETGTHLASGESLSAGSYSKEYSYTPNQTSTYTVCGYLDEAEYSTPDATGSGDFTNVTPQTRAAEATLAAEKAAREAERAAEVKKEQEAAAKQKYEEEAPAREAAKQAANLAKYEAEVAAAKASEHKRPVKHLSVTPVTHNGHSRNDPGYTNLDVNTSPYAHLTIKLSRYGHISEHLEWGEYSKAVAMVIPWSCKSPGGTYHYTITARSNVGKTLTKSGHFSPVSVERCHEYEAKEAEARERHEREVIAGYEQEAREERERRERYENNCRKLGGEPVVLEVGQEYRIYCKAPGGGTIPVPY